MKKEEREKGRVKRWKGVKGGERMLKRRLVKEMKGKKNEGGRSEGERSEGEGC